MRTIDVTRCNTEPANPAYLTSLPFYHTLHLPNEMQRGRNVQVEHKECIQLKNKSFR